MCAENYSALLWWIQAHNLKITQSCRCNSRCQDMIQATRTDYVKIIKAVQVVTTVLQLLVSGLHKYFFSFYSTYMRCKLTFEDAFSSVLYVLYIVLYYAAW